MYTPVYKQLQNYINQKTTSFHIPGHKNSPFLKKELIHFDLTEIEGLDNLHSPNDIIKKSQENAARVYQTKKTFYLVNGSTVGILAAMLALTNKKDKIIMARNSHRSVYNGVILNELDPCYVYPDILKDYSVPGSIHPKDIEAILKKEKDIKLIIITSPTYEGIISDIKAIASIAKRYRIPLIVDEAHGSHLAFNKYFPSSAIEYGADIVIHSLHKTLPSLTQTALLHINDNSIDAEKIKEHLSILQTSSPSYVLLSSIDYCIGLMESKKEELFNTFVENIKTFRKDIKSQLNVFNIVGKNNTSNQGMYDMDLSRLVVNTQNSLITGNELEKKLKKDYNIQIELANKSNIIAMATIGNSKKDFDKLLKAILDIDRSLKKKEELSDIFNTIKLNKVMTPYEAKKKHTKTIKFVSSKGYVASEFIIPYPPGIPVIAPGEELTQEIIELVLEYKAIGIQLIGMWDTTLETIQVIK
ncbi:lysine decarboxylase [Natranaerovirga hydrolytica]|uniref:Lysine decarboxylase n=1 Tax=Natranaerovirga hydrolytica TaxID=680378 RepID=A0A4R1N3K4_9FIRM|nr:aminotransferase class I/II-fold pyridoxal phosphate-dependent enzyme [Natranaerovirga hydrolytica]TCL00034.1 lysine decarboxylase [Natranaerovirga hydrolytica]